MKMEVTQKDKLKLLETLANLTHYLLIKKKAQKMRVTPLLDKTTPMQNPIMFSLLFLRMEMLMLDQTLLVSLETSML